MRAPFLAVFGIIGLIFFGPFPAAAQTTDGIYADFTTSLGNFTVTLDFTNAPKTAANFIGLATGQRAWMDWKTGSVRTNPFYNNLIFHRVVSNSVIQAGSPDGIGDDGPGYVIMDEFSPLLTHNKTGVIGMAKGSSYFTGAPLSHSGGSQFYITLTSPLSYLDGVHPVFGQVSSNLATVLAIGRVATDTNTAKPLTNVVINSVSVRRVGTAAQNFNIQAQPLPVVQKIPSQITEATQQVTLHLSNNFPYAETRVFDSSNLLQWSYNEIGLDLVPPLATNIYQPATNRMGFYNLSRIQYPSSTWAPSQLYGQKLTIMYSYYAENVLMHETNTIHFDYADGGVYNSVPTGGPGTVTSYTYARDLHREPYRGYPTIYYSGILPMDLELNFTSETGGNLAGTVYFYGIPWYAISGTFTLVPSFLPGPITLLTPANGSIQTNLQTTFTWSVPNPPAPWYNFLLYRNNTNLVVSNWLQTTTCVVSNLLASTNYTWWVRGRSSDGDGQWSSAGHFIIPIRIPAAIQLVSPSGTTTSGAKDYTWVADPYATWYHLLVYKNGTPFFDQWYAKESLTPVNPNRLSVHVSNNHTSGSYSWWVQALGPDGTGPWSATMTFTIP